MVGELFINLWNLTAEMAPYLLLGFAVAAVINRLLPSNWVEKHLGKPGVLQSTKATLLGIPLPLCSCGIIPVSAGLRKQGAGKGATSAFLVTTPQTGVDSILATAGLLGWPFALLRTLAAAVSGLMVGLFSDLLEKKEASSHEPKSRASGAPKPSWRESLHFGLVTLPGDIALSLGIGIFLAALAGVILEPGLLGGITDNLWINYLLALGIGIPVYVCSTGSIPLALTLLHLGFSPGAALIFLISGPATNAATLSAVVRMLGTRHLLIYLATLLVVPMAFGIAVDMFQLAPSLFDGGHHHGTLGSPNFWQHLSALLLVGLLAFPSLRKFLPSKSSSPMHSKNNAMVLQIDDMECRHCESKIRQTLQNLPDIKEVHIDLSKRQASFVAGPESLNKALDALTREGYPARQVSP